MTLRVIAMNRRTLLRRWIPQGIRDLLNFIGGYAIYYRGDYRDWVTARRACDGYDESRLLTRLASAAHKVATGKVVWEQDGVTWDHIPIDWPLSANLGYIAHIRQGYLRVLDFGGGFGSSFHQCRAFFGDAITLDWGIVEQPAMVEIARDGIESGALRFFLDIESAIERLRPDVALLSGVLQYLESPWEVLEQIIKSGIPFLIIDRHPCSLTHELITVQVVPPSLYAASYPSWLFNCPHMLKRLSEHYELLASWDGKDPNIRGWGKGAEFKGFFFRRREGT
ncbi:methyltransferase, TIGR04325 family [Magnetovirga frankeli]|uniref:methyltransferase, TIGR04325 family n=1 Tax=Magnetovirga frankeli TaxID=947516 RepID=UPI001294101F|nr:methyltransferase, TIGR04325 family [gamma proteobacterium SS-5]